MAVQMGIMCEKCRRIYFILTSSGIKPTDTPGMYVLSCGFCTEKREFRKELIRPYRVQGQIFGSGYATEGEYDSIPVLTNKFNEPEKPSHKWRSTKGNAYPKRMSATKKPDAD